MTVVIDRSEGKTKVLGISKTGGTIVGPVLMKGLATMAEARWEEFSFDGNPFDTAWAAVLAALKDVMRR